MFEDLLPVTISGFVDLWAATPQDVAHQKHIRRIMAEEHEGKRLCLLRTWYELVGGRDDCMLELVPRTNKVWCLWKH